MNLITELMNEELNSVWMKKIKDISYVFSCNLLFFMITYSTGELIQNSNNAAMV